MITTTRRRIAGLAAFAVLGVGALAGCSATTSSDTASTTSAVTVSAAQSPADVLAALARGETVDPSKYYFRTTPRFETSAPAYAYLNRVIAIASADRRPGGPIYTIEEVL